MVAHNDQENLSPAAPTQTWTIVIHCPDAEEDGGEVEIAPTDTYEDLRAALLEQLDEEMLPEGFREETLEDYDLIFKRGMRVATKQASLRAGEREARGAVG